MKKKLLLLFLCSNILARAYTLEEIETLRKAKAITQEDYLILLDEVNGKVGGTEYYALRINGKVSNGNYKIKKEGKVTYLPLKEFLKGINMGNTKDDEKRLKIYLGSNLREIVIRKDKQEISESGKKIAFENVGYKIEANEIYLREDLFSSLFLSSLNIDESTAKVNMQLNFMDPEELNSYLTAQEKKMELNAKTENIVYAGERSLFDLGYVRVVAEQQFNKAKGEKGYTKDWNGSLEYQGGLLYGQFQAEYDVDENILSNTKLEYKDIWKSHSFVIEDKEAGGTREWGLSFQKDKSYFTSGTEVVISESVPLGSRAELKYMGTTIAIRNEGEGVRGESGESGKVIFKDSLITSDRTYELFIYTPDGKITKKTITTVEDYNQQNKNEVEYSFRLNEDSKSDKYTKEASVFYGATDHLTLGAGYKQGIEEINGRNEYINDGTGSIVYGNSINGLSYVLSSNFEKSFDDYVESDGGKDFSDKYKYDWTFQTTYGKFKYILKDIQYGKYYDEKEEQSFEVQYDILSNLRVGYGIEKLENYNGEKEENTRMTASYSKGYKRFLFSANTEVLSNDKESYSIAINHTGINNINTKLENKWTGSLGDYETTLSVYNNNFLGLFDYTADLGYSQENKDKFTFSFTMNYDNWLSIKSNFDKEGAQAHSIGLDRIIDLKNPTKKLDSIDVSRVNAITFIDENDNNIFDEGEKRIENVDVTIGQETLTTDKNGEVIFSNISNGLLYDLKPEIKKPSFTLGTNKIQVKSAFSSTVNAYIPVKPMLNLNGNILIDSRLNLSELEKEELYSNVLIEIKDLNDKTIDAAVPDNTGVFDISGLFPTEYYVEIEYIGTNFSLPKLREIVKMDYTEDNKENKVIFDFYNNKLEKEKM
ncbi:MAG: hypothetical protein ACRC0S_00080 [Fusobacteriaceae bacterium]